MSHGIHARFHLQRGNFKLETELDIPARGVTGLYGPSGSGKTTLLRCLAGLERAEGHMRFNGDVWQDGDAFMPVHQRPIGVVFQEPRLFAHLSVHGNLEYGMRRKPRAAGGADFDHVVAMLGIGHLLARKPERLSGGEAQRVAIGRALLTHPRLLLMDEPLAALDSARKTEIMPFLERLHRESDCPIIYVSHHMAEMVRLADHLLLIEDGKTIAAGPLAAMLTRLDLPISHEDDAGAVIDTTVAAYDAAFGLLELDSPIGKLFLAGHREAASKCLRVRILARDVSLALTRPEQTSILNIIKTKIVEIDDGAGAHTYIKLEAGGTPLLARLTRKSCADLGLQSGQKVYAQMKGVAIER
ncbi:MAG: molybdenum ABC transporter ATP-binding protein [Mariprofundaceae bacterium]